jgi:hypothetical protein
VKLYKSFFIILIVLTTGCSIQSKLEKEYSKGNYAAIIDIINNEVNEKLTSELKSVEEQNDRVREFDDVIFPFLINKNNKILNDMFEKNIISGYEKQENKNLENSYFVLLLKLSVKNKYQFNDKNWLIRSIIVMRNREYMGNLNDFIYKIELENYLINEIKQLIESKNYRGALDLLNKANDFKLNSQNYVQLINYVKTLANYNANIEDRINGKSKKDVQVQLIKAEEKIRDIYINRPNAEKKIRGIIVVRNIVSDNTGIPMFSSRKYPEYTVKSNEQGRITFTAIDDELKNKDIGDEITVYLSYDDLQGKLCGNSYSNFDSYNEKLDEAKSEISVLQKELNSFDAILKDNHIKKINDHDVYENEFQNFYKKLLENISK